MLRTTGVQTSGVASPKIWGGEKNEGGKMFDTRRITLFSWQKRLSKHKMTIFSKNFVGAWPLYPSPGCAMLQTKKRSGDRTQPCRQERVQQVS